MLIPFTKNVMLVRDWEKQHLPVENSALALDLFLLISYNTLIDKPLTLKLLFHSTVFSEAGIRKHLRRWVDGLMGSGAYLWETCVINVLNMLWHNQRCF